MVKWAYASLFESKDVLVKKREGTMDRDKTSMILRISVLPMADASRQNQRRFLTAIILFVCLIAGLAQAGTAWGGSIFHWKIPDQAVFPEVGAIAAAPDDHLWVLEYTGHRIFKFDPNNSSVLVTITGDKLYYGCIALAVDSSGNVYASSYYSVLKFDSSGNFLGEFEFTYGEHIAVDSSGSIYLTGYGRIQKFDSSGSPLAHWGTLGSGDGQFGDSLGGIAVDGSGNIYVTDTLNYRVQKFDSSGNFLAKWGTMGKGDGQFRDPHGIAVDSAGNVYVTDSGNKRVQKFDSSGNFLAKWQISSIFYEGLNPFPGSVVAVDSAGNVYVNDYFNQLQKLDGNGNLLAKWGTKGSAAGFFNNPLGVALDSSTNIYVADSGNKRVQKFDSSGNFLAAWGSYGSGAGQFTDPSDVTVNRSGDVYVSDSGNHCIQKFDSSGNLLAKWGSWGGGNGQFRYPNSVTVDRSGNVYVADQVYLDDGIDGRIQKFDGNGNFITQWRTWVSLGEYCYKACFWGCTDVCTDEYFPFPSDLAVDATGNVYLLQKIWFLNLTTSSQIFKFDSNGNFLARWATPGSEMAVDSFNNIYVTENKRIQKFDSGGNILAMWRNPGSGDGQFISPQGIAVDRPGNVYVADT